MRRLTPRSPAPPHSPTPPYPTPPCPTPRDHDLPTTRQDPPTQAAFGSPAQATSSSSSGLQPGSDMEQEEQAGSCLDKDARRLGVNDVYEMAKLVGAELEQLIERYGQESVQGLIPKVVRILEMLESFVARSGSTEQELIRAFVRLQEGERSTILCKDLDHKINLWHTRIQELQKQISQLTGENEQLVNQLVEIQSQEDSLSKKEREVMLKLKEVVDLQRDEIRAKGHEISCKNEDVDALQQQLDRILKVNDDLRHKTNIVQTQLKTVLEKKAELEVTVQEKEKEIDRLQSHLIEVKKENRFDLKKNRAMSALNINMADKIIIDLKDPNRPCFTKQEMRQILHERNELKANLFLVQEELAYYQREIFSEGKCPTIFMEAINSAIKKQRKKVKAKMLGIPESICSSDEEDGKKALPLPCFPQEEMDAKPPESRIKSLFGFLYRGNSVNTAETTKASSESWEVIGSKEVNSNE